MTEPTDVPPRESGHPVEASEDSPQIDVTLGDVPSLAPQAQDVPAPDDPAEPGELVVDDEHLVVRKRRPWYTRAWKRVWNKKTKRRFRSMVLQALYLWWRLVRPVVPGRVVIASDSRGSLSGNLEHIARDLRARYPEREVFTALKPGLKHRRSRRDAFRLPRLFATAELIIIDDYYPIIYPLRLRKQTTLAQVWHAAGAFKLVGYSRGARPGGTPPTSRSHRGYSFVTVSAESLVPNYVEAFRASAEVVRPLGVPRTDVFFDAEYVEKARARVRNELDLGEDDRVVLYAPTFRGRGQRTAHFDVAAFDWEAFHASVPPVGADGRRTVVLLKQHPFVRSLPEGRAEELGFRDVSSYREVNDLLLVTDVLVTDYSSVIFEYALLGRPMVFFTPDLEEYTEARDFYYPFSTYLVGPVVQTTRDLGEAVAEALADGVADPARYREFVERFVGACDGASTPRVTDALVDLASRRRRGAAVQELERSDASRPS